MESSAPLTPYWQPALGRFAEAVTGLDDIAQSIRIILTTPLGSDLHRPEFGNAGFEYLDRPVTIAVPRMVQAALRALRRWEPRILVRKVAVTPAFPGAVVLTVTWAPLGGEDLSQVVWLGGAA